MKPTDDVKYLHKGETLWGKVVEIDEAKQRVKIAPEKGRSAIWKNFADIDHKPDFAKPENVPTEPDAAALLAEFGGSAAVDPSVYNEAAEDMDKWDFSGGALIGIVTNGVLNIPDNKGGTFAVYGIRHADSGFCYGVSGWKFDNARENGELEPGTVVSINYHGTVETKKGNRLKKFTILAVPEPAASKIRELAEKKYARYLYYTDTEPDTLGSDDAAF